MSVYFHPPVPPLTPRAESLKARANQAFAAEKYITGLHLYNQAAEISPNSAVLYSNRAAALMKRKWYVISILYDLPFSTVIYCILK